MLILADIDQIVGHNPRLSAIAGDFTQLADFAVSKPGERHPARLWTVLPPGISKVAHLVPDDLSGVKRCRA